MTRRAILFSMAACMGLAGVASAPAHAQGEQQEDPAPSKEGIALGQVPDAPRKTIEEQAKGGTVEKVERMVSKDGTVTFRAEIKHGKRTRTVDVDSAGKLLRK